MDRYRIALVIPAFNEALTIYDVVINASKFGQPIVVDDCSRDDTGELAKKAGAIVVTHEFNQGYDGALNSGVSHAFSLGFEFIVTLDADGQHDPSVLSLFVRAIDDHCDLILGIRNKKPRFAEHIFAFYAQLRYGICDPLCGMKGYRRTVYDSLGYFDSCKSIGTELALHALREGFLFKQIFLTVNNRVDQPRFGGLLSSNLKIMRALLIDLFQCQR